MKIKTSLYLFIATVLLSACKQNTQSTTMEKSKTTQMKEIKPYPGSSEKDFEFYAGKWKIENRKLKKLFSNCTEWITFDAEEEVRPVLYGLGLIGQYRAIMNDKPFEGTAIHLFNPKTKLWSNHWADSNNGAMEVPVVGSFENNKALFYAYDVLGDKKIIIRFNWDVSDKNNPVWEQAFSDDDGKTWEVNWIMNYSRI